MLTKKEKQNIVQNHGGNLKNTGSAGVQIAILTADIEKLKPHFAKNKKDKHSKRGFLQKVQDRKTLLKHLSATNPDAYKKILVELKLRK